jgi:hypothetical protein
MKKIVTVVLIIFVAVSLVYLVSRELGDETKPDAAEPGPAAPNPALAPTASAPAPKPPVADKPIPDSPSNIPEIKAEKAPAADKQKVIAYYFHTTKRCYSCRKIEELTSVAVESNFAGAIKDGRLELKIINVEDPENRHFIKDYQLYTKSVIVAELEDGKQVRWKNLDKVWKLLRDEAAFIRYVSGEVGSYLEEG